MLELVTQHAWGCYIIVKFVISIIFLNAVPPFVLTWDLPSDPSPFCPFLLLCLLIITWPSMEGCMSPQVSPVDTTPLYSHIQYQAKWPFVIRKVLLAMITLQLSASTRMV